MGKRSAKDEAAEIAPSVSSDNCSCHEGNYCIDPKGARYCFKNNGQKSHLGQD